MPGLGIIVRAAMLCWRFAASGETEEILQWIAKIKRLQVQVICTIGPWWFFRHCIDPDR